MLKEIILAIVQAATEFLPISSSGHLALISNMISEPNLFFFTTLHLASLLAVIFFTRKEIYNLVSFNKKYRKLWIYIIIATIPGALVGYLFKDFIVKTLSSYLYIGIFLIFTAIILFMTRFAKNSSDINSKNSIFIGLFQALALFPGISRSGMTISSALFSGVNREKAVKFSFLLFIPLSIGAFLLELGEFYISPSLVISFIICLMLSYLFLKLLYIIVDKGYFWIFSIYCLLLGLLSLIFHFSL